MFLQGGGGKKAQNSYVVHHELSSWGNSTKEMYFQVNIKNGVAYIDNKEYEIRPTNIDNIPLSQNSTPSYYTLDGRRVSILESLNKGIYIILQKGKKKKIYH